MIFNRYAGEKIYPMDWLVEDSFDDFKVYRRTSNHPEIDENTLIAISGAESGQCVQVIRFKDKDSIVFNIEVTDP